LLSKYTILWIIPINIPIIKHSRYETFSLYPLSLWNIPIFAYFWRNWGLNPGFFGCEVTPIQLSQTSPTFIMKYYCCFSLWNIFIISILINKHSHYIHSHCVNFPLFPYHSHSIRFHIRVQTFYNDIWHSRMLHQGSSQMNKSFGKVPHTAPIISNSTQTWTLYALLWGQPA
jgi:hypothetical protein